MLRHSFLNDLVEKNKDLRYRIFKNDIEERGTTLTKFRNALPWWESSC
jgi:hypothetical protein